MSTDTKTLGEPVIEARGLTKRYGAAVAVDALDLTIHRGEVFGLLGPNGAGKTTTILLLLGLTEPSGGTVKVLGRDPLREPLAVKRRVGYLPDAVGFYDTMTARENLAYTARLGGIREADAATRIDEALERVRLPHVRDRKVQTFSRGMRQRLGIAELLVKRSEIAILDEPTSGLDPQSTQELLELITRLARDGMTIVLSSHLLGMVQAICSRVALFNAGKAALVGRVDELAGEVLGGSHVVEFEAGDCDGLAIASTVEGVLSATPTGPHAVRVDADRDVRADLARAITAAGGSLTRLSMDRTSLDEVYARYFEQVQHAA
ncbi:ABC transporter ATP-binding protein [Rhizobium halophytocola]|uniref:ABC-2 type transport system ATP-binding protein n=1 Tax=Rhizobium halophytocola TaxID=735519 RepID=A0ABS4E6J8_9HYPH|nr:ABC transporter ATP-binding protein [Rhizobium halophytocola]MBP1853534.1 ABC-2 type transport system ATP-binding protein [Rhizobium halophytocola]